MAREVVALGAIGRRVGQNLRSMRIGSELTLNALATKLSELGRPIDLSALAKVEKGQRRVDVDDLVALAIALDVSPNQLLLPEVASRGGSYELTPEVQTTSQAAWSWALRDRPRGYDTVCWDFTVIGQGPWLKWIHAELQQAGYTTFDNGAFFPGPDFAGAFDLSLRHAAYTFLLMNDGRQQSSQVVSGGPPQFERSLQQDLGQLVPIVVAGEDAPPRWPAEAIDLRNTDAHEARARLLEGATNLRGERPHHEPTPPPFPGGRTPEDQQEPAS